MADWNSPVLGSAYASFHALMLARDVDAATLFIAAPTNPTEGMIRYVRASDKFQEYLSGVWTDKVLSIAGGGTGVTSVGGISAALSLGTMAIQDSNSVAITGGSISGISLAASVISSGNIDPARMPVGGTWATLTSRLVVLGHETRVAGLGAEYRTGAGATLADTDFCYECTGGTVTLPSAATVEGRIYVVKRNGTAVTFATTSSQTIDGLAPGDLPTLADLKSYWFQSDGANWKLLNSGAGMRIKEVYRSTITINVGNSSNTHDFATPLGYALSARQMETTEVRFLGSTTNQSTSNDIGYGYVFLLDSENIRATRQTSSGTTIISFEMTIYDDD